jgi:hypothetical protein
MKKLLPLLLILAGCGTPAKQSTTTTTVTNSNLPQIAGTWTGGMNFTVLTGSLTFTLAEDASGNLSGTAASTPPGCSFSLPVNGAVYQSGSFYVQTPDTTTASFAGSVSNKTTSGNVNLGNSTGCGPRTGGTFAVQEN